MKMAKFRHNLHSQTDKIMSKKTVKTTTLTAQMTVCKMETGMDYVQVTPDNPCVGQVEAFRGLGYGQMLSTGSFEFTKHRIVRSQAVQELKLPHSSVSRCKDATHRFTFPHRLPHLLTVTISRGKEVRDECRDSNQHQALR